MKFFFLVLAFLLACPEARTKGKELPTFGFGFTKRKKRNRIVKPGRQKKKKKKIDIDAILDSEGSDSSSGKASSREPASETLLKDKNLPSGKFMCSFSRVPKNGSILKQLESDLRKYCSTQHHFSVNVDINPYVDEVDGIKYKKAEYCCIAK